MRVSVPIAALATARSFLSRDVQELAIAAGLSEEERQKLRVGGLSQIPVAAVPLDTLISEVLDELQLREWDRRTCTLAVFTHSLELNPAQLSKISAYLSVLLPGLAVPPILITGRPCSVLHLGIEIAASYVQSKMAGTALVIGADAAPTLDDRFFFGSAMGDAAVGLVLGGTASVGELLAVRSTWQILASEGARSPQPDIERFRAQNPTAIRGVISETLADAGLDWSDLSAIVPHTPYRSIWDTIAALCRFPRERILDDGVERTGHLNSNDVLVHLVAALQDGRLRPGDIAALVSPGFGGTRGCTLIRCGHAG